MAVDSTLKVCPTSSFLVDQVPLTVTGDETWELPEEMEVMFALIGSPSARAGAAVPQIRAAAIPIDASDRFTISFPFEKAHTPCKVYGGEISVGRIHDIKNSHQIVLWSFLRFAGFRKLVDHIEVVVARVLDGRINGLISSTLHAYQEASKVEVPVKQCNGNEGCSDEGVGLDGVGVHDESFHRVWFSS
nr:MAG TPA: hypothetical protein [Caudoviricetes sp.]